ncbi:MAG: hypothetical protein OEU95_01935 [Nitrospirota bacterium]|nr:hypothetical protein [Nitrospirota bacterium]
MTTINFNILNFYGPDRDRSAESDGRLNARRSEAKEAPAYIRDRVIDVTPYCRVADACETDDERVVKLPFRGRRSAGSAVTPGMVTRTYDRRGRAIPYLLPKGMNVDEYV